MDILGIHRGLHHVRCCWNLYGEHSELEGKAPSALLVEGATQAPVIEWIFSAYIEDYITYAAVGIFTVSTANLRGRLHQLCWWRGRRKPR